MIIFLYSYMVILLSYYYIPFLLLFYNYISIFLYRWVELPQTRIPQGGIKRSGARDTYHASGYGYLMPGIISCHYIRVCRCNLNYPLVVSIHAPQEQQYSTKSIQFYIILVYYHIVRILYYYTFQYYSIIVLYYSVIILW